MKSKKVTRRQSIRYRIRRKINGSSDLPRMSVFRSNKDIYVQLIDDITGVTLAAASSKKVAEKAANKTEMASAVGKLIAETATEKGITKVVFDRSGYLYHGRVKALAEGAREGGLKF